MEKWRCSVCGYVHEGPLSEDFTCPVCKQPASKFEKQEVAQTGNVYAGTKTEKNLQEAFAGESQGLCFATGQEFPDALAGAALAARLNATVILLPKSSIEDYPRLKNAIAQYPCNFETQPYIFGGEGAVSPEQVAELKELLENTYVAVNLTD